MTTLSEALGTPDATTTRRILAVLATAATAATAATSEHGGERGAA